MFASPENLGPAPGSKDLGLKPKDRPEGGWGGTGDPTGADLPSRKGTPDRVQGYDVGRSPTVATVAPRPGGTHAVSSDPAPPVRGRGRRADVPGFRREMVRTFCHWSPNGPWLFGRAWEEPWRETATQRPDLGTRPGSSPEEGQGRDRVGRRGQKKTGKGRSDVRGSWRLGRRSPRQTDKHKLFVNNFTKFLYLVCVL